MGAAKAKREALRNAMLDELERWMEPAFDYEAQLMTEIEQLEFIASMMRSVACVRRDANSY